MKKREIAGIIFMIIIIFTIILFLMRLITPREIDDVNPLRNCEKKYLEKSEILWVIPYYNEIRISENKSWCNYILSLNKTLGLHGIKHQPYHEFETQNITQKQLNEAIKIFQECLNQTPKMFKAPGLAISPKNRNLINSNNISIRTPLQQTTHKVYHCSDSGTFPNWFHDIL